MARKNRDIDKSASRFLDALRRTTAGLKLQQQRVLDTQSSAPRLEHVEPETLVYPADYEGNDLDYYIYELARLRAIGKSIEAVFNDPQVLAAGEIFDQGIPRLRDIRNPLTHPTDTDQLDEVAWFSSVMKLKPGGDVEYLIDPRYQHHDIAIAYTEALTTYLRDGIKASIAADPPLPIDEQIKRRRNEANSK